MIAVLAAGIAWWNTTRTLRNTEKLDRRRRAQKHAALRAVLPLALSEITRYAADHAKILAALRGQCQNGVLVHAGHQFSMGPVQVPGDIIATFAEFIEFSDDHDVTLFKSLLRGIQIQQVRFRSLIEDVGQTHGTTTVQWIEQIILDTATIYAGAAAAFEYARGEQDDIPEGMMWKGVRTALNVMGPWQNIMPSVHATIDRREQSSPGPK